MDEYPIYVQVIFGVLFALLIAIPGIIMVLSFLFEGYFRTIEALFPTHLINKSKKRRLARAEPIDPSLWQLTEAVANRYHQYTFAEVADYLKSLDETRLQEIKNEEWVQEYVSRMTVLEVTDEELFAAHKEYQASSKTSVTTEGLEFMSDGEKRELKREAWAQEFVRRKLVKIEAPTE